MNVLKPRHASVELFLTRRRAPRPGSRPRATCAGAPSSEAAAVCANVSGMLPVLLRMRVNVYYMYITVRVPLC